ncbi:hypothetical protein N332_09745, partial [Mesitornis unicolor]
MHMQQLKVERRLSIAASQPAPEAKAKTEGKAKAKTKKSVKSPKSPKVEVAGACSQSHAGSHGVPAHGKPRVVAVKESTKAQRPR